MTFAVPAGTRPVEAHYNCHMAGNPYVNVAWLEPVVLKNEPSRRISADFDASSLPTQRPQSCPQRVDFVQQFQCECHSDEINADIALQA